MDTPGLGNAGLWGIDPRGLGDCFPEIRRLSVECRFRGCAHRAEPDCRVKAGVEAAELTPSRYESYLRLLAEAEAEAGASSR